MEPDRMDTVKIHEFEPDLDFKGAIVIDGFPSVGLVSTIVANYLIDILKMRQVGVMDHEHFPTLSVVHNAEPHSPVRLYSGSAKTSSGKTQKLAVFVSEFQPPPPLVRPIGEALLDWVSAHQCDFVISPEGLVLEGEAAEDDNVEVFALSSTPRTRKLLEKRAIEPFREGIITGVCGVLMNTGKRREIDVISILAEAHANYPDARSASRVIEIITRLLDITVDLTPLLRQAEGFERQIKMLQRKASVDRKDPGAKSPSMYG
jgi:uncharacterized protein